MKRVSFRLNWVDKRWNHGVFWSKSQARICRLGISRSVLSTKIHSFRSCIEYNVRRRKDLWYRPVREENVLYRIGIQAGGGVGHVQREWRRALGRRRSLSCCFLSLASFDMYPNLLLDQQVQTQLLKTRWRVSNKVVNGKTRREERTFAAMDDLLAFFAR